MIFMRFKVFLDYDNKQILEVFEEAKRLSKKYGLGGFIIRKSSPFHYHVVFDKEFDDFENVKRIVLDSSADEKFKGCLWMGFSVLRTASAGKKRFIPKEVIKYCDGD